MARPCRHSAHPRRLPPGRRLVSDRIPPLAHEEGPTRRGARLPRLHPLPAARRLGHARRAGRDPRLGRRRTQPDRGRDLERMPGAGRQVPLYHRIHDHVLPAVLRYQQHRLLRARDLPDGRPQQDQQLAVCHRRIRHRQGRLDRSVPLARHRCHRPPQVAARGRALDDDHDVHHRRRAAGLPAQHQEPQLRLARLDRNGRHGKSLSQISTLLTFLSSPSPSPAPQTPSNTPPRSTST